MRLVTSFVAALVVATQLAAPVAEACGGDIDRTPAMFFVTHHHGRTFVLLGGTVPESAKPAWKSEEMSFDPTQIAAAPPLATALDFTLAGTRPAGPVSTKSQAFLSPSWESRRALTALEIQPAEGAKVAVLGTHVTTWTELVRADSDDGTGSVTVSRIDGTDVELVTDWATPARATSIRVKGRKPWGSFAGRPLGMVTVDGERFLVLLDDGRITPVRV